MKKRDKKKDKNSELANQRNEFFEKLYLEHYARLIKYAERRLDDHALVQDLVAETMTTALEKIDTLMVHKFPKGWLIKVLSNKIRNETNRKRYRSEVALLDIDVPCDGFADMLMSIPEDLPEIEKNILILRYQYQLDFHQIAERLGMKESAVRKRHSRTLIKCRKKLAPENQFV